MLLSFLHISIFLRSLGCLLVFKLSYFIGQMAAVNHGLLEKAIPTTSGFGLSATSHGSLAWLVLVVLRWRPGEWTCSKRSGW